MVLRYQHTIRTYTHLTFTWQVFEPPRAAISKCHPQALSEDQGGGSSLLFIQMALNALSVLLIACLACAAAPLCAAASIEYLCLTVPGDLSLAFVKDAKNQQAVRHGTVSQPLPPMCVGLYLTAPDGPLPSPASPAPCTAVFFPPRTGGAPCHGQKCRKSRVGRMLASMQQRGRSPAPPHSPR